MKEVYKGKEAVDELWKRVFWAAAHPTRLHILTVLFGCHSDFLPPLFFTDLQEALQIEKSGLSYHLKLLRKAGLVRNRYPLGKRKGGRSSIWKITLKGIIILKSLRIPERLKAQMQETN